MMTSNEQKIDTALKPAPKSAASLSVMKEVRDNDDRWAEVYMKTDDALIRPESFIKNIRLFSKFLFSVGKLKNVTSQTHHNNKVTLKDRPWKWFDIVDYFDMYAGKYHPKDSFEKGATPLVSSSDKHNGVSSFTNIKPLFKNSITIGKTGIPVYYQPIEFVASFDVTILTPLFEMSCFSALFIISLLSIDKCNDGRQISLNDFKRLRIRFPINKEEKPDWQFMEYYIKSLPYSSNLKEKTYKNKKELCDSELVDKYESGEIDFEKVLGTP